jgi:hypothetical protein
VTAALAFGGFGLILATMFYAFEVIDQRALQEFKAQSRMIQPKTGGSAPASPGASDSMPVTQQTATAKLRECRIVRECPRMGMRRG